MARLIFHLPRGIWYIKMKWTENRDQLKNKRKDQIQNWIEYNFYLFVPNNRMKFSLKIIIVDNFPHENYDSIIIWNGKRFSLCFKYQFRKSGAYFRSECDVVGVFDCLSHARKNNSSCYKVTSVGALRFI